MRAIRVHEQGEPDVMVLEEVERPTPGEGQALVGLEAIGVNMIDVQQRSGAYPIGLPFTPGTEELGLVLEVGPGVTDVAPGDRVAWAMVLGAYADAALVPADRLVPSARLDRGRDRCRRAVAGHDGPFPRRRDRAAARGRRGRRARCRRRRRTVAHRDGGGPGLIVVGTVSTDAKAEAVLAAGATDAVVRGTRELPEVVRAQGDGAGSPCGVRLDRGRYLRGEPRLACPTRHPRGLRPVERPRAGVRPAPAAAGGLGVPHPARARRLQRRREKSAGGTPRRCSRWSSDGTLDVRVHERFPLPHVRATRTKRSRAALRRASCCSRPTPDRPAGPGSRARRPGDSSVRSGD